MFRGVGEESGWRWVCGGGGYVRAVEEGVARRGAAEGGRGW